MAKQTSSKSSSSTTPGVPKKKRTSEAPAPITKTILKADSLEPVTVVHDVIVTSERAAGTSDRAAEPSAQTPGPTHEQIAQRAFELYQLQSAGALQDWLNAERELRS